MRAMITYTGGKSYWTGHHKFKLNVPQPVTDPAVIQHCQDTKDFSVLVDTPKKVVREVVKDAPKKVAKKKTGSRRASSY